MVDRMTSLPMDVLDRWPGRWRYPGVVTALQEGPAALTGDRLVRELVAALAEPAASFEDAVRTLLDEGEFDAAESLGADPEQVGRARDAEGQSVSRRVAELRLRNQRTEGKVPEPADLLTDALRRRTLAAQRLAEWESAIEKREQAYAQVLVKEARSRAGDRTAWLDSVKLCVRDGEYRAARQLIEDGPGQEDPSDPSAVPRLPEWPFTDSGLAEVLSWYEEDKVDLAPVSFLARWRPLPEDEAGWQLVRAVAALRRTVDATTVVALAAAIDAITGADGVRHPVDTRGGGFTVSLNGLRNPRFNRLNLAAEQVLWVPSEPAAEPPPDVTDLVVYGVSSGATGAALPRLRETDLLRLVAPDADHRVRRATHRQINLLRLLCRNMPPARVWRGDRAGEEPGRLRDDLRWTLDLLGLHHPSSVVDALMYDLSARADAIGVALEQLVPEPGQRFELGMAELNALRTDEQRMARLRSGVDQALGVDPQAAAVFYALTSEWDVDGGAMDVASIARILHDLVARAGHHPSGVPAADLVAGCDVEAAVTAAVAGGLMRPDRAGSYGVEAVGLAALFTTGEADLLPELARDALARLHHRTSEKARRSERTGKILKDLMHSQKATRGFLEATIARLDDPDGQLTPKNRAELEEQRDALLEQLAHDQQLGLHSDHRLLVEQTVVNLDEIWRKVRQRAVTSSPPTLLTDIHPTPEPCLVRANPIELEHAFNSIVQNAIQAIKASGSDGGRVEVVSVATANRVTIWIHDSGPGIPPSIREVLWSPERRRVAGVTGLGLIYARDAMTYLGGTLDLAEKPSPHGGSTFVVRLPLCRPVQHLLDGAEQAGQLPAP